jgi:hypothetical protein
MVTATKVRACSECEFHDTSLTILTEGEHSFPGLEFRCRHKDSSQLGRVVQGPEALRCGHFTVAVRKSDAPPF